MDTEFNGFGGELISLALVREDRKSLYITYKLPETIDPWVEKNVVPILYDLPVFEIGVLETHYNCDHNEAARYIGAFLNSDPQKAPVVVVDWPDDISYLCKALIVGPGQMVNVRRLIFDLQRVDAYPTKLEGAVQHNALWDAMALRELFV